MNKKLIFISTIFLLIFTYIIFKNLNKQKINESTKTCLVTGASHGIGYEISREMIKRGWKVIGIARGEKTLQEVAKEFGQNFIFYKCDVSDHKQVQEISNKIKEDKLQPTLFFLNAGTGFLEDKFKPMYDTHKKIIDTNYFGTISWVDEWINEVKSLGGGTFVATSSVNAIYCPEGAAGYGTSKSAINACFNILRSQYYYDNIDFVIVMPGPVDTYMLKTKSKLPFTHNACDEAKYIIKQVFKGEAQIEPSWFYACYFRIKAFLPEWISLNIY